MFCKYCGTQNDDGRFCKNCGAPLEDTPPAPVASMNYQSQRGAEILKKFGASPKMLALVILLVLSLTLNVFAGFMPSVSYADTDTDADEKITEALDDLGIDLDEIAEKYGIDFDDTEDAEMPTIRLSVISLLICIGLMMFALKARSDEPMTASGMKLAGVAYKVQYILLIVVFSLVAFAGASVSAFAAFIIGQDDGVLGALVLIVGIILLLVAAAGYVFCFVFIRKVAAMFKNLYRVLECGEELLMIPGAARAWMMLSGIFAAISAFSSLSVGIGVGGICTLLAGGCTAAVWFLAYSLTGSINNELAAVSYSAAE